jgi:hypothetical protein
MHPVTVDDGASRYQPAWVTAGPLAPGLIVVSEAGGIANLELIPLASPDAAPGRPRTLTRVTGGVVSPAVPGNGRAAYFLSMHSGGLDVHRLALADSADTTRVNPALARAAALVRLSAERTAVAPPIPIVADTFARGRVRSLGGYGLGPRRYAVWPLGGGGASGGYGGLALASGDPIGRLTWVLQGVYGERELWRGGALGVAWRGMRPSLSGSVFYAEQRPSGQSRVQPPGLDVDYRGATFVAELPRDGNGWTYGVRAGGSAGTLSAPGAPDDASRVLGFGEARGQIIFRRGTRALALSATLHGAAGRTGDLSWQRGVATMALGVASGNRILRAAVTAGALAADAGAFERFVVGGIANPFVDDAVFSQRLSHPALPLGITSGTEVIAWRAATRFAGAELYLWNASALGWRNEQHRLVGLEHRLGNVRLPIVSVPGIEARAGVAYSIDAPFRRELRIYGGLGIAP